MDPVLAEAAPATSTTRAEDEPFAVPEACRRARLELDWEAFLPPQAGTRSWRVRRRIKRGIDIVLASIGLLLLSPLLLLLAILVKLSSPGPVFYLFPSLGLRGRPFHGYKFRTMVENAEALKPELQVHNQMTGPVFKMRNDPRVTPIGRWLRKFSLDELPQLWNVLKGDMSLVGPRPPIAYECAQYEPWQWGRLAVEPGITCFWQISGRSELRDFDEWVRLDLKYIEQWSLWQDFKVLLRTVPVVIRGHGAY